MCASHKKGCGVFGTPNISLFLAPVSSFAELTPLPHNYDESTPKSAETADASPSHRPRARLICEPPKESVKAP
jgi:hypothetical protein